MIAGAFSPVEASRALDLIREHGLRGSVSMSDGEVDVTLLFGPGGLRLVCAGRDLPPLRARPAVSSLLGADELSRVQAELTADATSAAVDEREVLLRVGRVPRDAVDEAVREAIVEAFLDCLFLDEPRYEAASGDPGPAEGQGRPFLIASTGVEGVLEAIAAKMRALNEVRRAVSLSHAVKLTDAGAAALKARTPGANPAERDPAVELLALAEEEPGLTGHELAARRGLALTDAATQLHELVGHGWIALTPAGKAAELRRLHRLDQGLGDASLPLLRRYCLAERWHRLGKPLVAGRHLARAGGLLRLAGRDEEAVTAFAEALRCDPDDLEAREGYVQSLWATLRGPEAATESEELARRYLGLGLPARAKRTLERALSHEERTSALELMVEVLGALRQPKLASELGERLIVRLRGEGHADAARAVAARLLAAGEGDRKRLLRAAGVDRRKVAVLSLLAALLALAYYPVSALAAERHAYGQLADEVQGYLNSNPDLPGMVAGLGALALKAERLADDARDGAVTEKAAELKERLERMRADCQDAAELQRHLPWQAAPDAEFLLERTQAMNPRSAAFAAPLVRLQGELEDFHERALSGKDQLALMGVTPDAYALAARMREEFAAMPRLLEESSLRVRLDSDPPDARVRFHSVDYSATTPLELSVPLRGSRELQLTLRGHEPLRAEVAFEDLPGRPELTFALEPVARRPPRAGIRTTPTRPTPRPAGDPEAADDPSGARPGGVSAAGARPGAEEEAAARDQVELRDGFLRGDRDPRFRFEPSPGYFAELRLHPRYRGLVQAVSEIDGDKVYLVSLRCVLYVRRSTGWHAEQPVDVRIGGRLPRPVVAHPGNDLRVQPLTRTIHLDEQKLQADVRGAFQRAIRIVYERELGGRR